MKEKCLCALWVFWFGFCFCGSLPAQELRQYSIHIDLSKGVGMSGICIIRMEQENGTMSVMNEFGIKAFDAVYSSKKNKVKLCHVIGPLNKWYLRRIIARDMRLLFSPECSISKKRTFWRKNDGSMVLDNKRFKITYHLYPLKNVVE